MGHGRRAVAGSRTEPFKEWHHHTTEVSLEVASEELKSIAKLISRKTCSELQTDINTRSASIQGLAYIHITDGRQSDTQVSNFRSQAASSTNGDHHNNLRIKRNT